MLSRIGRWALLILCVAMASVDCIRDDPSGESLLDPLAVNRGGLQFLNFDSVAVGASLERRFVLRNRGTGLLVGEVASPCSEFVVVSEGRFLLAPGSSKVIAVRFSPPAAGDYACTLDTGALCDTVVAMGSGLPGSRLGCDVMANPVRGPSPLTVKFIGLASGGVPPYGLRWAFGDDSTLTAQDTTSHVFTSQPGGGSATFDVVFRVTDSSSAQCSTSIRIVVDPRSSPPLLCFANGPEFTPPGGPAQFSAAIEVATGPLGFLWDFGDSSFSVEQNPRHSYVRPGTYVVTLTVTDSLTGRVCEDSLQTTVLENN